MVVAAPEPKTDSQPIIGEQRLVLRGITWEGYLQILGALPESRNARLTYDTGVLEITVPPEEHEFSSNNIAYFLLTLVELMGLKLKSIGSTTMKYPGLQKGAEPDKAFYIQNHALVKGRNVDFAQDPPPDLVVEVDITHTDIQKNQFYFGVSMARSCEFISCRMMFMWKQIGVRHSRKFPKNGCMNFCMRLRKMKLVQCRHCDRVLPVNSVS
jgi:Uma2 family endonuclease